MTDDEAFVEGIVRRPANQLHRLVYANWLEERDDPRAEFMRLTVKVDNAVHRMVELASVLPEDWVEQVDLFRWLVEVFRLPALGANVEVATVKSVAFRVGDRVDKGQLLFTVETETAVFELRAERDYRVAYILVWVDEVVAVGKALAVLLRW